MWWFLFVFLTFFQNRRFTGRLPDHSTSFPQLTVFTNPDEQKPYKSKLCQICISIWQPWHTHAHYQSSIAIVKVNTIKLHKVKPFFFVLLPSLYALFEGRITATDTLIMCSQNRKVTSCKTTQKRWDNRTATYLSLKQSMSYFYLDFSTIEKLLSSTNFKEI